MACSDYDDDISNLQGQIDTINGTLEQLQNLIESGSVITSVTSGENGITITLSDGSTYTVTNGRDGAAGADGQMPTITIGENGHWFINGVDSGVSAVGTPGEDGQDGEDGQTPTVEIGANGNWIINGEDTGVPARGQSGNDGQDGKDGAYYYPGTEGEENGFWVKVEGDTKTVTDVSWLPAGTVTAVWDTENGYLRLYNVADSEGNLKDVSIKLTASLASLVFIPQVYVDGVQGLTYDTYTYNALTLTNKDSRNETATAASAETHVSPQVYADYHINPANADVEAIKENMAIVVRNVDYISTRAAASEDFVIKVSNVEKISNDVIRVYLDIDGVAATDEEISVFALTVAGAEGEGSVTSDYATVYNRDLADLVIAQPVDMTVDKNTDVHYRTLVNAVDLDAYNQNILWASAKTNAENLAYSDLSVAYNSSIDLKEYVEAHVLSNEGACPADPKQVTAADLEKLGFEFKYEVFQNYTIGTPATDQADFVTLEDGVFTPRVFSEEGRAAIGRTPIIRVSLMDGENIVKVAYIKVYISDTTVTPPTPEGYELTIADYVFDCEANTVTHLSTVESMNVQVYNALGMSKDQFHSTYPYFWDYGADQNPADLGSCEETQDPETQATHVIEWTIGQQDLWDNAGEEITHRVRYYTNYDEATDEYSGAYVELVLTSNVTAIQKAYNVDQADFISNFWNADKTYALFNVAVPSSINDADADNCTFVNDLNSPFTTWPANSTEGTPGVLRLDEAVTGIDYFFCNEVTSIRTIGGVNVTFDVVDGTALYATVGGVPELVATINNETMEGAPNIVTYNKASAIAKQLLNTGEMYTYIRVTGYVCDDETKTVSITFNSADHYRVNFVRPVDIATEAADNFVDGVDVGEEGSYIRLEDLISPSDWRNRPFSRYENYWGFYGPFTITADLENAECDLNGVRQGVPTTIELDEVASETMGNLTSDYGFITYKNNGTTVNQAYNLYVKVQVDYGWGTIMTDFITIRVEPTIIGQ